MILPYVYMVTHKITGQFYIGLRCSNKAQSHLDIGVKYFTSSKYVKELGFENFQIEIIAEFFEINDAYDFEQKLIHQYFKIDPLCLNKNCRHNSKSRFNTAGTHITQKHKDIIRKHNSGPGSPNYGKKLSEEHKRKCSLASSERKHTNESKAKISKTHKGKVISEETKAKISKALSGENSPKYGKTVPLETKEKISNSLKGKYIGENNHRYGIKESQETKEKLSKLRKGKRTNGDNYNAKNVLVNGIIYNSIKEAAIAINKPYESILGILRGRYKLNEKVWQTEYIQFV